MNEEKSSIKNIIIILLIILIFLLIGYLIISKSNMKVNSNEDILEAKIKQLNTDIESLTKDKTTLDNKILELNNQVNSLNDDKKSLNDKVKSLNSSLTSKNSKISSLEKNISTYKNSINDLTIKNNDLLSTNNSLSLEKENLISSISQLESEKATLESKINELNSQILELEKELKDEKETYTVFYSYNNKTIYQVRVKKGNNVDTSKVPISSIEGTYYKWDNDGKNIQSDIVIYGVLYCTLTFESSVDVNKTPHAFLSLTSYDVPYGSEITFVNGDIKLGDTVIVSSQYNSDSIGTGMSEIKWSYEMDAPDEGTTYTPGNDETYVVKSPKKFTVAYDACLAKGTNILMGDGSIKKIENLTPGEKILSYDGFSGNFEEKSIVTVMKGISNKADVITINLENGSSLKIVDYENVFLAEKRNYFLVDKSNYESLVGKHLLVNENGKLETSKVLSVSLENKPIEHYTIYVEGSSNYIAEGIVAKIPGYWDDKFFTYDEKFMIDQDKLNDDIENYGLYTYEEVKDYVSYELFNKLSFKYAKFIEGKGLATHEFVLESLAYAEYEITMSNKRFK